MNCGQALQMIATYLDRELTSVDEASVGAHLEQCKSCFSRMEFERRLKEQLTSLNALPVNEPLQARVQSLIRTFGGT
jgi:anti-sigma factor (TIGR02949 family)